MVLLLVNEKPDSHQEEAESAEAIAGLRIWSQTVRRQSVVEGEDRSTAGF